MTQRELLEIMAKEPGIIQAELWDKHPELTRDYTQLSYIKRKGLADREPVLYKGHNTYKWYLTEEGRKALSTKRNTITLTLTIPGGQLCHRKEHTQSLLEA